MDIVLLIIGFVLLVKGADFFVSGASDIARKLKVSALIIGLTIVAFGTSAPELAVSISASSQGSSSISVGNIIGSNLFNLLVVLGSSAAIVPAVVSSKVVKSDYPVSIAASVLICLFAAFPIFAANEGNTISRPEGIILLAFFAVYLFMLLKTARKQSALSEDEASGINVPKSVVFLIGGIAGIVFGSRLVVAGASGIARAAGISEEIIGLTIVAIGTSLPELVTSIVAAKKGENDIAIGNVVGSNLFNILLIGGICAVIAPTEVSGSMIRDMVILIAVSAVCFIPLLIKRRLLRGMGIAMICAYGLYTAYLILLR